MVWEFLKFRYFGQIWQPKLAKIHIFAIFDIFLGKFSHKRGTFGGSTTLGKLTFYIYHCSMMLWRSDVGILKILIIWPIIGVRSSIFGDFCRFFILTFTNINFANFFLGRFCVHKLSRMINFWKFHEHKLSQFFRFAKVYVRETFCSQKFLDLLR